MNEDLIITMAVSVVIASVKNPQKKTKMKKAMLKIYQVIKQAYAGDPDFA